MQWLGSPELTLSLLMGSAVKATFVLALTAIVARAMRNGSAATRHHAWVLGIACSLALPSLTLLLPSWRSATLGNAVKLFGAAHTAGGSANFQKLPFTVIDAAAASPFAGQWINLIFLLWVLGAAFVAVKLLAGLTRLAWISTDATPIAGGDWQELVWRCSRALGIARPVKILLSADPSSMPLTWGLLWPRILLPTGAMEWSEERRKTVLSHELAHIARHDWLAQICGELTRAIYWFHPLVWFAAAKLRSESEQACDDCVLNSGVDPSQYANQLLELARTLKNAHRRWSAALAFARPTNLERRFIAMLNPNLNRGGISRRTGLLLKLAAFCLILPLAAIRLPGQNLSGKFNGTIFDPSDGAVPNATIVMTNHKANTVDMTVSDAEGNFVFKALPAGEYEMKVLKPGFAAYLAPQVVLQPGRDLTMTAKLDIGGINETVDVRAEGSAKSAATEAPTEPKTIRIRIGGKVEAAKVIQPRAQPVYPQSAKAAGVQGSVLLHAVIGMDGIPHSLEVLNSQINPDLARAAVEAVSQWRYQSTLLNGEPVEVDTTITINFTLLP